MGFPTPVVGADAHIGPWESYEFAVDPRKDRCIQRADRVVRPYGTRWIENPAVVADDSVGPKNITNSPRITVKTACSAGPMCTGKRQTHIRNAPSSRAAVTGIGHYNLAWERPGSTLNKSEPFTGKYGLNGRGLLRGRRRPEGRSRRSCSRPCREGAAA